MTHHQAQPQPPTIVLLLSEKQPPDITRASFGPLVQTFPMTTPKSSIKKALKSSVKLVLHSHFYITGCVMELLIKIAVV